MIRTIVPAAARAAAVIALAAIPLQAFAQAKPDVAPAAQAAPAKTQSAPVQAKAAAGRHPDLVRLAYGSGWEGLPAVIGIERGFFDQEDIVVSGMPTTSAQGLANSLTAGSTDFAEIPQRFFIALAASNVPIAAVAVGESGTGMELVAKPGSPIKSVTDLKGKTVGIANATESLGIFMRVLNAAKMAPADVKVTLLRPAEVETALEKGKADAIFESSYYTLPLVEAKKAEVVMSPEAVVKSIGVIDAAPLVTTKAMIEKQPQLVERVVLAWIRSLLYIQQNPKDAAALLQIYLHRQGVRVPLKTAEAWVGMAQYNRYGWTKPLVADAEYNAWGLQQAKVLKMKDAPKLAQFVDNEFAEKAEQTLGVK